MSDNLSPERSAGIPLPLDVTPSQAVHEYLEVGPMVIMGDIPVENLSSWGAVLTHHFDRLTPEQHFHAASIRIEEAYTHGQCAEPPGEIIRPLCTQAREHLSAVREKPGFDRVLGALALGTKGGVTMYESISADDENLFAEGWAEYYASQMESARELLRNFERFGNISDVPAIHSTVAAVMISMFSEEGIFCLPAPSRAIFAAHEAKNAWSLQLWHSETDRVTRGRIAATGPAGLCLIPPSIFENSTYPSRHGQGALQSIIDTNDIITSATQNARKPSGKALIQIKISEQRQRIAREHAVAIRKKLMSRILYFFEHGTSEVEQPPQMGDHTQIYVTTDPHCHPSKMDEAVLNEALSELTIAATEGELTPQQNRLLAWIRVELGMKLAAEGDTSASLVGEFNEAEDILTNVASFYRHEDEEGATRQAGLEAEADLGRIFVPLYKGVALGEASEVDVEEIRHTAVNELADVATQMLEEFDKLTDMTSREAEELYLSLQLITACLTVNYCSEGAHLAAISTPRQRGEGNDYQSGWHITIWPMNKDGSFKPDYYGRVRLDEKDNNASVDENVLTVAGRRIDNDNSFANLRNLIKLVDGKDVKPKGRDRLAKLHRQLISVAAAAEW
ncbi:MAG TPA: hypothetical protein VFI74_05185 [Candidatus Saccharimonadales bacterium]|nr:hypothetical protein [Candidatus Saccharimonadales bacterium]